VNDETNNFAVTDHLVEVIFNGFLSQIIGPFLAGLGESLLLACEPDFRYFRWNDIRRREEKRRGADLIDLSSIGDYCS
jgi:hypothetical protein